MTGRMRSANFASPKTSLKICEKWPSLSAACWGAAAEVIGLGQVGIGFGSPEVVSGVGEAEIPDFVAVFEMDGGIGVEVVAEEGGELFDVVIGCAHGDIDPDVVLGGVGEGDDFFEGDAFRAAAAEEGGFGAVGPFFDGLAVGLLPVHEADGGEGADALDEFVGEDIFGIGVAGEEELEIVKRVFGIEIAAWKVRRSSPLWAFIWTRAVVWPVRFSKKGRGRFVRSLQS